MFRFIFYPFRKWFFVCLLFFGVLLVVSSGDVTGEGRNAGTGNNVATGCCSAEAARPEAAQSRFAPAAVTFPSAAEPEAGIRWQVEGVMSDACQCLVFCPCEFLSTPTFGHCDDAAILHIEKGHYGEVRLDGLRVAVVSESPQGERLVDAVGRLKFARIYVPAATSDEQMAALAAVARHVFGAFVSQAPRISADEKVQRAEMEVTIRPHFHRVSIPGILEVEIQTLTGADGKNPIVMKNGPFEEAGFGEVLVARSNVYTYKNKALGIDWNYGGRSASIRTFQLSGE